MLSANGLVTSERLYGASKALTKRSQWSENSDNLTFVVLGVYVKVVKREKSLSLLIVWDRLSP